MFNVDAERTAWLCWKRIAELAEQIPDFRWNAGADFRRVQADEKRHARLFQILADVLDENDALAEGHSTESLTRRIGGVSELFLPRRLRSNYVVRNSLGGGGKVWVLEGASVEPKLDFFQQLLRESKLAERIQDRAGEAGRPVKELKVAIKPTFILGYDRSDTSIITDPPLLDALARYLREAGCDDIAVVEARNIWGERDKHFPTEHARRLHGVLPNARLEIIPGAGHWMQLSMPDVVAQQILEFAR